MNDKQKKAVSRKVLGVVYLLISALMIIVGYIAHLTNTVGFSMQMPESVLDFGISQINLYFLEYTVIGFFTGIFLVLGILYLKGEKHEDPWHRTKEEM